MPRQTVHDPLCGTAVTCGSIFSHQQYSNFGHSSSHVTVWMDSQTLVLKGVSYKTAIPCGDLGVGNTKSPRRDESSWTALLWKHTKCGQCRQALGIYEEMRKDGVKPSSYTFVAVLKACSSLKDLETVKKIHAEVVQSGSDKVVNVGNVLVDVYAKCGSVADARHVFETMPHRNVVSWTAMILGYANMAQGKVALQLYARMQQEGVQPNDRTFVAALKACCVVAACEEGTQTDAALVKKQCLEQVQAIHSRVVTIGCELRVYVGTMLVDAYAKCGSLWNARAIFEKMPYRNVVSWTAMILGHAQMQEGEESLHLYARMQQEGVLPNDRTFVGVLKACSSMAEVGRGNEADGLLVKNDCLRQVRVIHAHVIRSRSESDVFVGTMLVDVYAKCGSLVDARRVFEKMPSRDVVSWNAIILGYAQMEQGKEALHLYRRMQQEGVIPNVGTFVAALKACSRLPVFESWEFAGKHECLEQVRAIHFDLVQTGCESAVNLGNMLVDVYARCGSLVDARCVFDRMPHRNVVSWNSMILGYAQMEEGETALQLYGRMQQEGILADDGTFVGILKACGVVAGLEKGKEIHRHMSNVGLDLGSLSVGTSLIDMYGKCGSMEDAQQVFDALPARDVVTWSALIAGYAHQGDSDIVFDLFQKMRQEGIQPDSITFLSLLTACIHVGLVDKGRKFFEAMTSDYGITPTIDHYTCMIDLLGRAGQLDKAMAVANKLPSNGVVWKTLLGACQKWVDVKLGRQVFERAVNLDKTDLAPYVLMSNIYAAAHMLKDAKDIRAMAMNKLAWKKPGQSWWTDRTGVLYRFQVGDREHPESQDIFANARELLGQLKDKEYARDLDSLSDDENDRTG